MIVDCIGFLFLFLFEDMKGSKPGLTSIAVINLIHCREWTVLQEPNDDTLEPLYPVDIAKVFRTRKRFERSIFLNCLGQKTTSRK